MILVALTEDGAEVARVEARSDSLDDLRAASRSLRRMAVVDASASYVGPLTRERVPPELWQRIVDRERAEVVEQVAARTVAEVRDELPRLTDEQLEALLLREARGAARTTALSAIATEIRARGGR